MAGTPTIRDDQLQAMAEASATRKAIQPCGEPRAWIEIRLVDTQGKPIPGERYRLRLPDASIVEGLLDEEGKARVEGILSGQCKVSFPGFDAREWRAA
jgi:hypothetical protein